MEFINSFAKFVEDDDGISQFNYENSHISKHKKELRKRFIIRNMEPFLIKWDLIIILMAIYNSFQIPLGLAFKPPSYEYTFVKIINSLIDICFFFDIILSFRTTYFNPITGAEIFDPKKIAKNYLKGRFWIDLTSTLPFELINNII